MDTIYKYRIWRNIFMLCKENVKYEIDPKRPDLMDFLAALREFQQRWGKLRLSADHRWFCLYNPIEFIDEIIADEERKQKENEQLYPKPEPEETGPSKGEFFTNAMNPEVQAAFSATVPTNPIQPPGVPPSQDSVDKIKDKYGVADEDLYYKAKTAPQSDDLPLSGINTHKEKESATDSLKQANTEKQQIEDYGEF